MGKKQAREEKPKEMPSHTDEARQVVEEYANDLRENLEKFRKRLN
jgi:vacuolar-type H+-ATPase subunit H